MKQERWTSASAEDSVKESSNYSTPKLDENHSDRPYDLAVNISYENAPLLRIILRLKILPNSLTNQVIQDKVRLSLERTKATKQQSEKASP